MGLPPPKTLPPMAPQRPDIWGQRLAHARTQKYVHSEKELRSAIRAHCVATKSKNAGVITSDEYELTRTQRLNSEIIIASPIALSEPLFLPNTASGLVFTGIPGALISCAKAMDYAVHAFWCSQVHMRGLTFSDDGYDPYYYGIYLEKSSGFIVEGCEIDVGAQYGLMNSVGNLGGVQFLRDCVLRRSVHLEFGNGVMTGCRMYNLDIESTACFNSVFSGITGVRDILLGSAAEAKYTYKNAFSAIQCESIVIASTGGNTSYNSFSGCNVSSSIDDSGSTGLNAFVGITGGPSLAIAATSIGAIGTNAAWNTPAKPAGTIV